MLDRLSENPAVCRTDVNLEVESNACSRFGCIVTSPTCIERVRGVAATDLRQLGGRCERQERLPKADGHVSISSASPSPFTISPYLRTFILLFLHSF
jgi:hypothetical protein